MRRLLLIFGMLVFFVPLLHAQTYTVCNLPGIKADFNNLQQAADSVPAGSTLFVFPSPASYGNLSFSKRLDIIGTGFMLGQNDPPYTSPNATGVTLTTVTLNSGASYSSIEGIQVVSNGTNCITLNNVQNVTITRCMTYSPPHSNSSNIFFTNTVGCTVSQCYLFINGYGCPVYVDNGSQRTLFSNNIIDDRNIVYSITILNTKADNSEVTFDHNTFIGQLNTSNFGDYNYTNNIFYNSDTTKPQYNGSNAGMTGNLVRNNIATDSLLFRNLPANQNYSGANPDSLFLAYTFGYHSWDQKWEIQTGSFANTYAADGGEAGAFGTNTPYVLSGIPNLPAVYAISITPDTAGTGKILVHIQAKASY